ncbi:MAG TPA: CPXCG motif-containing cysteine-rich protein [Longimicrobiales bacterium]|nr:CPXCG motif-containing cysteine-rich protein [Longimicrobiales bacterium]
MPRESDPHRWLEDAFPEGDGTADTAATVVCPYCGEANEIAVDPGGGARQEYVEDCPVCCQPWTVRVRYDAAGQVTVEVEPAA